MNLKFLISAMTFCLAGIFSSQATVIDAGSKEGSEIDFDVTNVVKDGSHLVVDASIDMTKVNLKGNREIVLTPMIVNDTDTVRMESLTIAGRNRFYYAIRNGQQTPLLYKGWGRERGLLSEQSTPLTSQISANTAENLGKSAWNLSFSTDWQNWMDEATVVLDITDRGCANCKEGEQNYSLAITDFVPKVYEAEFIYVTPVAEVVKTREINARAFIDFPVNRTEIYPDYRRNPEELAKIRATIDSIKNDKDITVTSLHIAGTASPEGGYQNNVRLAKGRTEALKDYVQKLYRFPAGFITTSYEPVDWAGLREWLQNARQNMEQGTGNMEHGTWNIDPGTWNIELIDQILAIVNGDLPPEQRNTAIKTKYPTQYQWLLENVYPALRHSDYTINFDIKTFTDIAEILEILQTAPQKLSLAELFMAANSQPEGSDLYNEAFELAARMYPNDVTANLNAGVAAMKRGDLVSARRFLAKSGDSDESAYAKAVLTALEGDNDGALKQFGELAKKADSTVAAQAKAAVESLEAIRATAGMTFRRL